MSSEIRSSAQSPVPRAWAHSAPLPTIKEDVSCERCDNPITVDIIKLRFNAMEHTFCSKTCLKIWVFKVIK